MAREALQLYHELDVVGILTYVDNRPMAVCAGFALTEDTFDICVAKSVANLTGLGYYSKREMFMICSL